MFFENEKTPGTCVWIPDVCKWKLCLKNQALASKAISLSRNHQTMQSCSRRAVFPSAASVSMV